MADIFYGYGSPVEWFKVYASDILQSTVLRRASGEAVKTWMVLMCQSAFHGNGGRIRASRGFQCPDWLMYTVTARAIEELVLSQLGSWEGDDLVLWRAEWISWAECDIDKHRVRGRNGGLRAQEMRRSTASSTASSAAPSTASTSASSDPIRVDPKRLDPRRTN